MNKAAFWKTPEHTGTAALRLPAWITISFSFQINTTFLGLALVNFIQETPEVAPLLPLALGFKRCELTSLLSLLLSTPRDYKTHSRHVFCKFSWRAHGDRLCPALCDLTPPCTVILLWPQVTPYKTEICSISRVNAENGFYILFVQVNKKPSIHLQANPVESGTGR